jgi:hypothetical protein
MFRNQLLIVVSALTVLALASSAQAEVIIRPSADGGSEVQTSNIRVGAGTVSIRRNSRIRKKKNRYGYSTKVAPRVYYPVVNPDRDDDDADYGYGQTTTRSSSTSSSSSTVNGRTHSNTQTTTVQGNGRTVTHSNTRD